VIRQLGQARGGGCPAVSESRPGFATVNAAGCSRHADQAPPTHVRPADPHPGGITPDQKPEDGTQSEDRTCPRLASQRGA